MDTVMSSLSNKMFVRINTLLAFPELDFIMSTDWDTNKDWFNTQERRQLPCPGFALISLRYANEERTSFWHRSFQSRSTILLFTCHAMKESWKVKIKSEIQGLFSPQSLRILKLFTFGKLRLSNSSKRCRYMSGKSYEDNLCHNQHWSILVCWYLFL